MSDPSEEALRVLYLDWCSTQVARRFLELSLDEVWLLSQSAAALPPRRGEPLPQRSSVGAVDRIPGYLELVRKTALLLAEEMDLPPFALWKESYLASPGLFQKDLLRR